MLSLLEDHVAFYAQEVSLCSCRVHCKQLSFSVFLKFTSLKSALSEQQTSKRTQPLDFLFTFRRRVATTGLGSRWRCQYGAKSCRFTFYVRAGFAWVANFTFVGVSDPGGRHHCLNIRFPYSFPSEPLKLRYDLPGDLESRIGRRGVNIQDVFHEFRKVSSETIQYWTF